ncbi:polysaccharide deacetylase family protein [Paenibacillus macquariensis]|uniref:Polysaccharide deacetylase n=1 Tax=Paenibacillus macquariensis TaxID=948756 RepID=A0ABY1K488_9BACL|nr:polysaccharide deacetylase family protein [Paenibacillus macquariensis]MEC0088965.1 polysaccharide deacetylase family protein [Paenibacillus macquariensis]OAB31893.1 polysaccharide deacetylase [Paenibacillus macquariensis subsp. macquariensis]SIR23614.1 Polysaccharide deacetylase [Paenibacillus macquariensis]
MTKEKRSSALNYRRKDRKKVMKTIIQAAMLLTVGILLFQVIFNVKDYAEPVKSTWTNHEGFIALSYFGVDRTGTPKLVAKKQLDQQLKALYDQGYSTISQQDVMDYYQLGKALPDKALFLSFEDGRNDSSLFAQPLLEKYNFKATFLSYANKVGNSDRKFLQPKDMLKMMRTGYWELGSNGYRLTYINVFDKEGRYIGVKDENQLRNKENVEYYNHYLMDFIRDENMIPLENRDEMTSRINMDYQQMNDIYMDTLGFVPNVYMIMHANTLYEGMNRLVSDVNDVNIQRIFNMHFNREGNMYNDNQQNLFDLTRVQPEPYWYTNHLLMKVEKDTQQRVQYIHGDDKRAEQWKQISGAAEYIDSRIALTSQEAGEGKIYLNESEQLQDIKLTTKLTGNLVGKQHIYVRYDRKKDSYIRVSLDNNVIYVDQKKLGHAVEQIFTRELDAVEWRSEDLAFDKATVYTQEQTSSGELSSKDAYPVNVQQTRNLEITVQGDKLDVSVDKEPMLNQQIIDNTIGTGGVALGSEYNEQNKKDDIYDGVFDDLKVESLHGNDHTSVVFNSKVTGLKAIVTQIQKAISTSIDWAIDTF